MTSEFPRQYGHIKLGVMTEDGCSTPIEAVCPFLYISFGYPDSGSGISEVLPSKPKGFESSIANVLLIG
jgi:hypothetical protein